MVDCSVGAWDRSHESEASQALMCFFDKVMDKTLTLMDYPNGVP